MSQSNVPTRTPDERIVKPNFITEIIDRDIASGYTQEVVTRFPPEPNGYLHLGHVKAIFLDFGVATDYGGRTYLRFDDTNPTTEDVEYAEAIKEDVRWLGFEWEEVRHASDYFERLYELALQLIERGLAYVDSLSEEEIREYRGTVTEPGRNSPYRDRPVTENLDLFKRMRAGEFPDGSHVLRAKIDMSSKNMIMRDPLLYRIRHASHYRTGNEWPIYPMYDFAHPLSDAIENITHSLCTLEFDNNREVYDWLLDHLMEEPRPHQYEFARLNLEYTVLSKRRLIELVNGGHVHGWDDPRMPTIAALRRRGVRPTALRDFVNRVGVTRTESRSDIALLEHSIRDDLNQEARRVLAVVDPLPVTITNLPADHEEELEASYWPHDVPREGSRRLPFSARLYIERSDFSEAPPKGWRRLAPGEEVRLRHGYVMRCDEVVRDENGKVTELRCSVDLDTLGSAPAGRKVKGTIHWLSARHAVPARFRLYDRLFLTPDPDEGGGSFLERINKDSLVEADGFVEPAIAGEEPGERYQFERLGYFWQDPEDSTADALVYNRIVTLKDTWGRATQQATGDGGAKAGARRERAAAAASREEPAVDPVSQLTPAQKSRYKQYRETLELDLAQAVLLASEEAWGDFFDATVRHSDNPQLTASWVVNELRGEAKGGRPQDLQVSPQGLAQLVGLVAAGTISHRIAKEVLVEMLASGKGPEEIVDERGLRQISDEDSLRGVVAQVIAANEEEVRSYRDGKKGLLGFFVGQVMRETGGRANPQVVNELLREGLEG